MDSSTRHDKLVANLSRYLSHQAGINDVKILHTHISSVILAGHHAYKIKRDIKLASIDFSRLEQRHEFCLKELQINRRTASDVYLDVIAIRGTIDQPRFDGTGPILDWAVKMRRFASGQLFSELALSGRLSFDHLDKFALHIASFHLHLPAADCPVKQTHDWLTESLDEIRQWMRQPSASQTPESFPAELRNQIIQDADLLSSRMTVQWDRSAQWRRQRQLEGWVRECHGDLHLANITCIADQVLAFDAIEFDQRLRHIDLVNEIAFVFMDLHAHGLPEHAWHLLNAYEQAVGDYGGLCGLDYYTRYRAVIRAKVALLSGSEPDKFLRYWRIACGPSLGKGVDDHLDGNEGNPPNLVLIAGLSGSGKSTVAQMLSRMMRAVWLRSDTERRRLYPDTDQAQRYSQQASERTYARLARISEDLLAAGLNVVVDATFLKTSHIAAFERIVNKQRGLGQKCGFHAIVCESDPALQAKRILQRNRLGNDTSEATPQVLARQSMKLKQSPPDWPVKPAVIENNSTLEELEDKIRQMASNLSQQHNIEQQ